MDGIGTFIRAQAESILEPGEVLRAVGCGVWCPSYPERPLSEMADAEPPEATKCSLMVATDQRLVLFKSLTKHRVRDLDLMPTRPEVEAWFASLTEHPTRLASGILSHFEVETWEYARLEKVEFARLWDGTANAIVIRLVARPGWGARPIGEGGDDCTIIVHEKHSTLPDQGRLYESFGPWLHDAVAQGAFSGAVAPGARWDHPAN